MNATAPGHKRPLWLATIVTWLAVPVGYALYVMLFELGGRVRTPMTEAIPIVQVILAIALPISAIGMFLFGLPLALWLRKRRGFSAIPICLAASVIGGLSMVLWFSASRQEFHGGFATPKVLISNTFGLAG